MMERVIHRAESRGYADNGWQQSYYNFSFASYYDPRRINFGALRVFNEVTMRAGEGWNAHPHDNMEIVMIPLRGAIACGDNLGNMSILSVGQADIISAGSGFVHTTYNNSQQEEVQYLVLWIFPRRYELPPAYHRVTLVPAACNTWQPVASPEGGDCVLPINQQAWISRIELEAGASAAYRLHGPTMGCYAFLIDGEAEVADAVLGARDAVGVTGVGEVAVRALSAARLLMIEVPMRDWKLPDDEEDEVPGEGV